MQCWSGLVTAQTTAHNVQSAVHWDVLFRLQNRTQTGEAHFCGVNVGCWMKGRLSGISYHYFAVTEKNHNYLIMVAIWKHCPSNAQQVTNYWDADKSLARPGRNQARKHVTDARDFNKIETQGVMKVLFLQGKAPKRVHLILTETLACFLPGRAKDLSAPL